MMIEQIMNFNHIGYFISCDKGDVITKLTQVLNYIWNSSKKLNSLDNYRRKHVLCSTHMYGFTSCSNMDWNAGLLVMSGKAADLHF
jgi:hypothetical protein